MTLPRNVKEQLLEAAAALDWSAGDWVLAAAAEHGPALRTALGDVELRKRPRIDDAAFAALYLTVEERAELDDQAVASGLNRSAFVTAVARLGLGVPLEEVVAPLRASARPASLAALPSGDAAGAPPPVTASEPTAASRRATTSRPDADDPATAGDPEP